VVVVNVEFEVSDERLVENSEYVQEEFARDKEIGGCRSDIEVREVLEVNGRYISKEGILELVKSVKKGCITRKFRVAYVLAFVFLQTFGGRYLDGRDGSESG
jgi:hypothetical protein